MQRKIQSEFFKKISVARNLHQSISLDGSIEGRMVFNLLLHRLSGKPDAGFQTFYLIMIHNECLMMEEGKGETFIFFPLPL